MEKYLKVHWQHMNGSHFSDTRVFVYKGLDIDALIIAEIKKHYQKHHNSDIQIRFKEVITKKAYDEYMGIG